MLALFNHLRTRIFTVLLSGLLMGITGLREPVLSATEPATAADHEHLAVTPDSSSGAGKGREGKGNHPMRKACAEDVKKLCSEVKAGEGRLRQCLKQHTEDLSPGCADAMQQRGTHRQ